MLAGSADTSEWQQPAAREEASNLAQRRAPDYQGMKCCQCGWEELALNNTFKICCIPSRAG